MASNPTPPGQLQTSARPVVNVLVATTAMLSFISFWRAGAIVLNDLASSAYYAGGEAEQFIGKSAPWFILGVMLLAYAVSLVYVESCSMFVRGGVYRVVKEAMGGTLAKLSVSALMFDYVLTGPISGVAAGQYIAGLGNELLRYGHFHIVLSVNASAATIAILVTIYFWWQNIKGIPESSEKALRIMQLTSLMVVILIVWCIYTVYVRGAHWPPAPLPQNMILDKHSLGWLNGFHFAHTLTLLVIFVGIGHSVLAMSGEETLAQVYREIEHPKLANLKKTALIIVAYSLAFTAFVSIFAVMIIPDHIRPRFFENLIGGLSMNLQGPFELRLAFHVFVVIVGMLILSGAVNTAIVGSNGVLSRVSEDGVLTDWFRHPHKRYGTTHRIITTVAVLQIVTILVSRGDVNFLGNLYAFGVTWSFAMKGIAVLVLRYTHPQDREYRVPLNFTIAGTEIPLGLGLITLILLLIATVNLFTKPDATIAGVVFSAILFVAFTLSEKRVQKQHGTTEHSTELDQFNLAQEADLTPASVGVRPGNILVPVSNYYALYHLHSVLERLRTDEQDIVVLHIRLLRRAASGEYDLNPEQLFSTIEQLLFTKVLAIAEKEGKPVRLAVAAANDLWDGILRSAANLHSASIVVGGSSKMPLTEQAREVGLAWERMPEPRPRVALEIVTAGGQQRVFYLGPHSPHLTPKEIDLLHDIWLRLSDELKGEEIHHHDIVHFALTELEREIAEGQGEAVLARLRQHLQEIKDRRSSMT
ncbi:MAG TPA: APC family permease [Candidatus Acidoferrales bacterium]|nr:APC family permease [Candidatus Acidoferrales bacterium]